jgi:anti-sigma B factor antagonist
MSAPLELGTRQSSDGVPVLSASGEIDMSNVDTFRSALGEVAGSGGSVVVDLTGVEYLDSAGLAVLFAYAHNLEVVVNPKLVRLLTIAGLTEIATVRTS